MPTANSPENNLSPWKPGQSGNPSGRPRGTRDLAGYVLETTDGGKELVDALVSIAKGAVPNLAVQKGSRPRKDQQVRPADQLKAIEMLLDRGFGRSPPVAQWLEQADGVEKTMALEALQVSVEATAKAATVTGVLPFKSPEFIKDEQSSRCSFSGK